MVLSKTEIIHNNAAEINRLTDDIQNDLLGSIQRTLMVDDINFTGGLSESFHKGNDGQFKTVETDNKYADFVDKGMPPGQNVNFTALFMWVKRKLGIVDDEEARIITFKIRSKIQDRGIPATRFVKKSIMYVIGKHGTFTMTSKAMPNFTKGMKPKTPVFTTIMKWINKGKKLLRRVQKIQKKTTGIAKPSVAGSGRRGRYYG